MVLIEHCVSLLQTGRSDAPARSFTDDEKVFFKLVSGVTAKRLDSLKTALVMIEVIKTRVPSCTREEQVQLFDNFVGYTFDKFNEPMAMAIIKYAVGDRRLLIKRIVDAPSWKSISSLFKPVMIENTKDPAHKAKFAKYESYYRRIKVMAPASDSIFQYVQAQGQFIVLN